MRPSPSEALGMLADRMDAALHAAKLPLPPQMAIEQLSNIIREVRDELATHVRDILGDDPWDTNPLSEALKDRPPQFAMGVDVRTVVQRVLDLHKQRSRRKAA